MLNKIRRYIASEQLLKPKAHCLVALSGGADSVALLLTMRQLGYETDAVHCNFHLRGDESNRDEEYCQSLCKQLNIPLHIAHFDTLTYAEVHKVSIEMAARELRYRYFFQLKEALGADAICVGHHQEDSVETILINLVRGTGLSGMLGIRPKKGDIVRPLLCVSRKEIEEYLHQQAISYVTDSTNLVDDVVRNKLRLNILPQLAAINPSVNDAILTTARHLMDVDKIVEESLLQALQSAVKPLRNGQEISFKRPFISEENVPFALDLQVVRLFPAPSYLLFYVLKPLGFTTSQITEVAELADEKTGQLWESTAYELTHDRHSLLVLPLEHDVPRPLLIPETGRYVYDEHTSIRLTASFRNPQTPLSFSKDANIIDLDAASIRFPLTLRRTEVGDRFTPLGMQGTQLVSDFLTNRKRNRFEKRTQLVLQDATGTILWIVGQRMNHHFRLTEETTECLRVEALL